MMSNKTGMTFESKINNKRVLHNGVLGVYDDFTPVTENTVNEVIQKVREMGSYLVSRTTHEVIQQTYGVMVNSGTGTDRGEAFVGYDESVDNKVRLCYATDTFLAMEITRHLQEFSLKDIGVDGTKTAIKEVNAKVVEMPNLEDKTNRQFNGEVDYGWGKGEQENRDMLERKVEKLCAGYKALKVFNDDKLEETGKEISQLIDDHKDILTKAKAFNKDSELYGLIKSVLEVVRYVIPNSKVTGGEDFLRWEMYNGDAIAVVYDKETAEGKHRPGNLSISIESPAYIAMKKLFDLLSSNIGYTKLRKEGIVEGTKAKRKADKQQQAKSAQEVTTPKEPKKEVNVVDNDYYDIYLAKAGKWGKADGKYGELKRIIEDLISECGIDGVSLRGMDATEVVIDWVIDGKSHTMALTKKATRVNVLEVDYDMAIAYDTDYPEMLGVLMKDKLQEVNKESEVSYDYGILA